MPKVNRWYFVRHAPVIGASHLLYRTADEPADVTDAPSFQGLARLLPARAEWITSPLQRAVQTADAIIAAGGKPTHRQTDPRLAEQHYGRWHGADPADIRADLADRRHKFWFTDATIRPPEGESFVDLVARVREFMTEVNAAGDGRTIVTVSHGGTIRAALTTALGLDPEVALGISVENLSTTRIDYLSGPGQGGDWRLVFTNARPPVT